MNHRSGALLAACQPGDRWFPGRTIPPSIDSRAGAGTGLPARRA